MRFAPSMPRRLLAAALASALTACATAERVPDHPSQPAASPAPAIDLAGARRCMDTLLLDQGPRELVLLADDAPGNGRELLAAALSDMTQRSRAVRIVRPGKAADGAPAPAFEVRGAFASADRGSVAMDASLVSTHDRSIVPGTAARTAATVHERQGRAELSKFAFVFSVPLGSADVLGQAQRAVADVAAIELLGRAARVPYWRCLGAAADDPKVGAEVQDWYDTMAARPAEIIGWFQQQLTLRKAYDGPVDGVVNAPLKDAVARYRGELGLSREPKLSLDFFRAWLAADHHALAGKVAPAPAPAAAAVAQALPVAPAAAAQPVALPATASAPPLQLRVAAQNDNQRLARGEALQLTIQPSRDAHVYCFHQDEQRRITRFFPNRFRTDSLVPAGDALRLPGQMRFEIVMNPRGVPESVACFATERDVAARLPSALVAGDFAALPVGSLEQIRSAFQKAADGVYAHDLLQMRAR